MSQTSVRDLLSVLNDPSNHTVWEEMQSLMSQCTDTEIFPLRRASSDMSVHAHLLAASILLTIEDVFAVYPCIKTIQTSWLKASTIKNHILFGCRLNGYTVEHGDSVDFLSSILPNFHTTGRHQLVTDYLKINTLGLSVNGSVWPHFEDLRLTGLWMQDTVPRYCAENKNIQPFYDTLSALSTKGMLKKALSGISKQNVEQEARKI